MGSSIRVALPHVVVRRELRARKLPENRAWNISRYICEKRRTAARASWGRRVYRQKILHSRREDGEEEEAEGKERWIERKRGGETEYERVKDDEERSYFTYFGMTIAHLGS